LEASRAPYSKSHERRIKRKEREQIAGGSLKSLTKALAALEDQRSEDIDSDSNSVPEGASTAKPKLGQIGASKSAPLSNSKRKKAL
jgi:ribosome biogenesis protein SLX9